MASAAVALLGFALIASANPAPASAQEKGPAYTKYVACGLSKKAKRSHRCAKRHKKGAFFRSNRADVFYTVCVKFPTKRRLCARRQEAVQGTLYVNRITSNIPGRHRVVWFVKGKRVGLFKFFVPKRANNPQRKRRRAG